VLANSLIAIAAWICLLPSLYVLGTTARRWVSEENKLLEGVYFFAFGVVWFVYFVIVIGSLNYLKPVPIVFFLVIVSWIRRAEFKSFLSWFSDLVAYPFQCSGVIARFAQVGLCASLGLTALFCFLPEIANDALCYQLNIPKRFASQSSIWPIEYDGNSYMPLALNYLYSVGLLFGSVAMAKLFHWWLGVLLSVSIAATVENLGGRRSIALLSAVAFLLTPATLNQMTTTYVDVGCSFFAFLSLLLLIKGVENRSNMTLLGSGLLMGFLIGVKLSLMAALIPMVAVLTWQALESKQLQKLCRFAAIYSLGCALGCGYWLIRNYVLIGNPTFPYFGEIFGTVGFSNYSTYLNVGPEKTLVNFLLIPLRIAIFPHLFGQSHWLGPAYLVFFPFALWAGRLKKGRPYLIFLLVFATIWFLTTQANRYFLPAMPMWIVAGALGISRAQGRFLDGKPGRVLGKGISSALIIFLLCVGIFHYRFQFLPIFGVWSQDTYLRRMERTYPIAQWVNETLPPNVRILNSEEVRQYYFKRPIVREANLNIFVKYWEQKTPKAILDFLRARGFTHILKARSVDLEPEDEPRLAWLGTVLADPRLTTPLVTMTSENIREARYNYAVYKINT
jgi:hypothetical protein